MFKLIFVKEHMFAIQDTNDGAIDICTKSEICKFLDVGIEIGGITKDAPDSFVYTDDYFVSMEEEDSESEDYEDDEDDYFSSDEDYEEDEEGYESDSEISDESFEDDSDEDDFSSFYDEDNSSDSENEDEDALFDGYDDDDSDDYYASDGYEETYVNRLYGMLSVEQKDLLKRYYLWSSQILFDGAPNGGSLRMTNTNKVSADKRQRLDALKKQGQDWIYAGFVDLEYHGGGHCTFGHALRFQHFAWDVSHANIDTEFWGADRASINWDKINTLVDSGHVIKFGIDCIGDFFDVPKETLAAIKSMQIQSLAEMEQMCKILIDPVKAQNARNSFGVFEYLADKVRDEEVRKKLFGKEDKDERYILLSFYSEFKKLGMLYPRSLVKRVQDAILDRTTHKYKVSRPLSDEVIVTNLKRFKGIDTKNLQAVFSGNSMYKSTGDFARAYLENYFFIQTGGIYCYNPYSENPRDRDEGMKNSTSRSYFNRITGTNDHDEKAIRSIMKTYQGYPYVFNQIRSREFRIRGTFDDIQFTPEYLSVVNTYQGLVEKLSNYPDLNNLEIPALELYEGVKRRSSTTNYSRYELQNLWIEFNNDIDISYSGKVVHIGSDVGVNTLAELCTVLSNRYDQITRGIENLKAKIAERDDAIIAESIKRAEERAEERAARKAEEEARKAEEEAKKAAEEAKRAEEERAKAEEEKRKSEEIKANKTSVDTATHVSENNKVEGTPNNTSVSNDDTSPESIFNRCKQRVSDNGLNSFKPKDSEILVSLNYALDSIPGTKDKLDAVNPVICKIIGTLKSSMKAPSAKQMYFVRLGFKEIMKQFDKSTEVKTMSVDTVEKYKLFEHPDIAQSVNMVASRIEELKNADWEDSVKMFRTCNAILTIKRLGYATKKQLSYLEIAKSKLGI